MPIAIRLIVLSALFFSAPFSQAAASSNGGFQLPSQVAIDQLDRIPGRQALKLALLTMDRAELTQAQRLQIAAPLFQQAIGAAEEIDINDVNSKLRDLARIAAQSSEAEKALLEPGAVELLETIKQPIQARLLFAVAMQNAAAESNDLELSRRATKWLQSIESKDPGVKFDATVQGCLSICRRQPLSRITEEQALMLGQIEVEKNKAIKKVEAGELDWHRITGSAGDLLLGMIFCWGVSSVGKMFVKKYKKCPVPKAVVGRN